MFTVLIADMVEEKGRPPGKSGEQVRFYRFCRGYGKKRGDPSGKGVKQIRF